MATGGTLFEELGFYYVGPVDAHDLDNLVPILENIRDNVPVTKPVLLHIKSVKGKGYPPAEAPAQCTEERQGSAAMISASRSSHQPQTRQYVRCVNTRPVMSQHFKHRATGLDDQIRW